MYRGCCLLRFSGVDLPCVHLCDEDQKREPPSIFLIQQVAFEENLYARITR